MPDARQVLANARGYAEHGTYWGIGRCEQFARTCAGAPALAPSATAAWYAAHYRHTSTPPGGSFAFWTGGSHGYGHVAISDGGGYCWSTDIKRPGRVDRVSIAYISTRWPALDYRGWAEDNNKVRVAGLEPVAAAAVTVRLANLRPGLRNGDVTDLQLALRRHGVATFTPTGYFGDLTQAAVKKFQQRQGWAGSDADGIPGPRTCALLGLHVV